jgi:hypothetical protein
VDFGFLRGEFGEDAAEAEGIFAEGGADEVVAGGGGVALVEDEVDDLEDGGEAGGEVGAAGDFEGDVFFGEGAFGADDALGDGGLGGEEGAGDLGGGEASEETEGEGGAGVGGEDRVAGDEDEAEEVVADGVVEGGVEVGHGLFEGGEVAGEVFVFALGDGVAAEEIDGAAFGGGGEPCCGVFGDTGLWPLLECGEEGFLREVFGEADVAGEAGEGGDDAGGLDTPDGFDGAMCGVMWIGSRHCYRSHQLQSVDARAAILRWVDSAAEPVLLLCTESPPGRGWARSPPSQRPVGFRLRSRRCGGWDSV